ncbi:hypothetical protein D3C86_1277160 [compost metagenome]
MPHFLGSSLPKFTFVTISYCLMSSRLLSFGPCSKEPKPCVLILPVAEMVAKSAKLLSKLAIAAIPPLLSISARRSSLNHTSPRISSVWRFFKPTIKVLTNPKLGFPLIPNRNGFTLPANEGSKAKSSTYLTPKASSTNKVLFGSMAKIFSLVNNDNAKSISFASGQTCSAESDWLCGVTFNGISTW